MKIISKIRLIAVLIFTSVTIIAQESEIQNKISTQNCLVQFNLNYIGATNPPLPITIDVGKIIELTDKPRPKRKDYRFSGWYTSAACNPDEEWLFGRMAEFPMPGVKDTSMIVTGSMTLYARWVKPVHITDAEGLDAIRNDLKGWFILDNDIDLSDYADWIPIGEYEHSYEFAKGEWWSKAFKGIFDGQGYTISNLNLTKPTHQMKALFGTVANGEIVNVNIKNCTIELTTSSNYAAPLTGLIKEDEGCTAKLERCKISNLKANVILNYQNPKNVFSVVTGLAAGVWNGKVIDCHVDGSISFTVNGMGGTGGEVYFGGIMGEGYSQTIQCSSLINLNAIINVAPLNEGQALKVFIGGLQASATNVKNSLTNADIVIEGSTAITELYVGGLVGSERYGVIENCASHGNIRIKNSPIAQVGGIIGEFSNSYGAIGTAFGTNETIIRNCYSNSNLSTSNVKYFIRGGISGSGKPEPLKAWGGTMEYSLLNCAFLVSENEPFIDAGINSFSIYRKMSQLMGSNLQVILDKNEGSGNWIYQNEKFPIPKFNR